MNISVFAGRDAINELHEPRFGVLLLMSLRILIAHNHYQQRGGEDNVFAAESALLEQFGHVVVRWEDHNERVQEYGPLSMAFNTIWSRYSYKHIKRLIRDQRPDIVHFHNTFMLFSPSVYYACKEAGVPIVQTLHNYRLLCPAAILYRNEHVCESCIGRRFAWPGVRHACYRGSRGATFVTASMKSFHQLIGTWSNVIDQYIALTEFAKQKFIDGGLPAGKIIVKPNFMVEDPGEGTHNGGFFLFVGRLSEEKGIKTLLQAWQILGTKVPLKIIGDGPLAIEISRAAQENDSIQWLGSQSRETTLALMKEATALLFPSVWYEGFPMVLLEALATSLPIICSKIGSMPEIVKVKHAGLHFQPGNPADLASKIEWALQHPSASSELGANARHEYLTRYTAERNYEYLMAIYKGLLASPGR